MLLVREKSPDVLTLLPSDLKNHKFNSGSVAITIATDTGGGNKICQNQQFLTIYFTAGRVLCSSCENLNVIFFAAVLIKLRPSPFYHPVLKNAGAGLIFLSLC